MTSASGTGHGLEGAQARWGARREAGALSTGGLAWGTEALLPFLMELWGLSLNYCHRDFTFQRASQWELQHQGAAAGYLC